MTTPVNPRIQVRLGDDDALWLAGRAERMRTVSHNQVSPNHQVILELSMWRGALTLELRRIRLTLAQASCIADVCNGWLMDAALGAGLGLVYAECYDAFKIARDVPAGLDPEVSSFGAKWEIDEQVLLDYLRDLNPVADHALRDAIARWWQQNLDATVEGFAVVGLRVPAGGGVLWAALRGCLAAGVFRRPGTVSSPTWRNPLRLSPGRCGGARAGGSAICG